MEGKMTNKKLSISNAAKQVSVEAHVLRYWEMELGLNVSRNAQGHRFYGDEDIAMFKQIKYLKEQGFRLQAIKLLLPDLNKVSHLEEEKLLELRDHVNEQVQQEDIPTYPEKRMAQIMPLHPKNTDMTKPAFKPVGHDYRQAEEKLRHFEAMMRKMLRTTIEEMASETEERICEKVTTRLLKEIDYLERQKNELQEKQLKLLQDILSEVRKDGVEAAATEEISVGKLQSKKDKKKTRKKKLFAKSET